MNTASTLRHKINRRKIHFNKNFYRNILGAILTVCSFNASSQSFQKYTDTINHFSINIPTGWKYGIRKDMPTIKLIAYYQPLNEQDSIRDNFNINIFSPESNNLENVFARTIEGVKTAKSFKLIDTGSRNINGRQFKWLIETHRNQSTDIEMSNYVFVTYHKGIAYILTTVSFAKNFETSKSYFEKLALSFEIKD